MLSELVSLDPQDERFDAKMTVLIENVRHHVEEEEKEWFPRSAPPSAATGSANSANNSPPPNPTHPATPSACPAPTNDLRGTAVRVGDT